MPLTSINWLVVSIPSEKILVKLECLSFGNNPMQLARHRFGWTWQDQKYLGSCQLYAASATPMEAAPTCFVWSMINLLCFVIVSSVLATAEVTLLSIWVLNVSIVLWNFCCISIVNVSCISRSFRSFSFVASFSYSNTSEAVWQWLSFL